MMIADIFITTKNRANLLEASLESLFLNTNRDDFRLTIVRDGDYFATDYVLRNFIGRIDYTITNHENEGLGPSINRALSHIEATNVYYEHPRACDLSKVTQFICYCQDDLLYTKDWLSKLAKMFLLNENQYNVRFASGVECIEHDTKLKISDNIILKDWIRAAQMFGRREYWMSMYPIPRFDVETGNIRAKPNDGIGSGVDWHFIRNHSNSVCKTGGTCLVMPGLVQHAGYDDSTWLKRELPESESDKKIVKESRFI